MCDWLNKNALGVIFILCVVCFGLVVGKAIKNEEIYREECQKRGGVAVSNGRHLECMAGQK